MAYLFRFHIFWVFLIIFCDANIFGQDVNSNNRRGIIELVQQAQSVLQNPKTTVSYTMVENRDSGLVAIMSSVKIRQLLDGTFEYHEESSPILDKATAEEMPPGFSLKTTVIGNREGVFLILNGGKRAAKLTYIDVIQKKVSEIVAGINAKGTTSLETDDLKLEEIQFNSEPCYRIIQTVEKRLDEDGKTKLNDMVEALRGSRRPNQPSADVSKFIQKKIVYVISKDHKLIQMQSNYNEKGDLISQVKYSEILNGIPFSGEDFALKAGIKVIIVSNAQEMSKFMMEEMGNR